MYRSLIPLALLCPALLTGCGDDTETKEKAKALVENTFASAVKPGPFATEALGKGVWYRAPVINGGCLQSKDWGHMDDPVHSPGAKAGVRRISPSFKAQKDWTDRTEKGWCIFLGNDAKLTVTDVNFVLDTWNVQYTVEMERPGGWWDCVDERFKDNYARVQVNDDGSMELLDDVTLGVGACDSPHSVPHMERKGKARPSAKPSQAPTKADVLQAAKRLDDALFEGDFEAAREAVSCYNLYGKAGKQWDACAAADFLNLGPIPRGGAPRLEDGPPWTMNAFKSLDDLGMPFRDGKDPTLHHVQVKAAKGKHKRRTMAIQWVDGEWKVVGVIGRLAEGLTTAQIIYDLDRRDRRDIFERRMKGEKIGDDGLPLDGGVRMGYIDPEDAEE